MCVRARDRRHVEIRKHPNRPLFSFVSAPTLSPDRIRMTDHLRECNKHRNRDIES